MRFLSSQPQDDGDAEAAAQQHQDDEYKQAITRLINQAREHEPDFEPSRNGPPIRRPQR